MVARLGGGLQPDFLNGWKLTSCLICSLISFILSYLYVLLQVAWLITGSRMNLPTFARAAGSSSNSLRDVITAGIVGRCSVQGITWLESTQNVNWFKLFDWFTRLIGFSLLTGFSRMTGLYSELNIFFFFFFRCSSYESEVTRLGIHAPVRVCHACYNKLKKSSKKTIS